MQKDAQESKPDSPEPRPKKRGRPRKAVKEVAEDRVSKKAKRSSGQRSSQLNKDGADVDGTE